MATSMDERWSIDKLDASNWMTWKFQMRHLLLAKGLWGHVDGTDVLADGANEQVTANFRLKSQKAFSSIVMAVSTSQLYLVTSCEGPTDAWDQGAICTNLSAGVEVIGKAEGRRREVREAPLGAERFVGVRGFLPRKIF
jgi:hypothetical protein